MNYGIASAVEWAKSPAEIAIPKKSVRESLRVGWYAKLIFLPPVKVVRHGEAEFLWVRIEEAPLDDSGVVIEYRGALMEEPQRLPCPTKGEIVSFRPEHVADFLEVL